MNDFDWADVKIFIVAPREMSPQRFTEIVKHYLPKGTIVLGIAEEPFVRGFENQPQFRMLQQQTVQPVIDKIAASASPHKVHIHRYAQNDLPHIAQKLRASQRVLLVNGSWQYAFHNAESYKIFAKNGVACKFISPFTSEDDAKTYLAAHKPAYHPPGAQERFSERAMVQLADAAAVQSFDYSFQTGAALGRQTADGYECLLTGFNEVVPYQTYALHHGNSREKHLSQPHDTNHYDTIHAEMQLLVQAGQRSIDLAGTTLFVNLLPCPNCARTLSQTAITAIVYRHDHSGGYAKDLLERCGKVVKQVP